MKKWLTMRQKLPTREPKYSPVVRGLNSASKVLDSGRFEAGHAIALKIARPAVEFIFGKGVVPAGFFKRNQSCPYAGDDGSLAPADPAFGVCRWQIVERQR